MSISPSLGEGAADQIADWLDSQGMRDYMVEIAGALRLKDTTDVRCVARTASTPKDASTTKQVYIPSLPLLWRL